VSSVQGSATRAHFAGGAFAKVDRGGYEEPVIIPKAASDVVVAGTTLGVGKGAPSRKR
jgi:hypothetical protein